MVEILDGERITGEAEPGSGGLGVRLLVDVEELGAVEVRSASGGVAPPHHLHRQHAEAFFVLEGELTLRLEDGEHRVGPETWVLVPPEVVHTFAVTGNERTHFLDLHLPSSGFGDFVRGLHAATSADELRAVRAAFDQEPAPDYATGDPGLVVIAGSGTGETIPSRRPEKRATLLVDADEITVTEFAYGPGERGAELHIHREHADAFLVVEGEFTFSTRDGSLVGPAGTLVFIPPGVVHGFDNSSAESARCFNLHVPASGFAEYLRGRNPDFDQHDPPAGRRRRSGVDRRRALRARERLNGRADLPGPPDAQPPRRQAFCVNQHPTSRSRYTQTFRPLSRTTSK